MKLTTCFLATTALLAIYLAAAPVAAEPERFQTLPYYPHRHPQPKVHTLPYHPNTDTKPQIHTLPYRPHKQPDRVHLMRARRATVLDKNIAPKPDGSIDGHIAVAHGIDLKKDVTLGASASASGNTKTGPVTTNIGASLGTPKLAVGINQEHTPGVITSVTKTAQANLLNHGANKVNANVFKQDNKLPHGIAFEKKGGSLEWMHDAGHSFKVSKETIPGYSDTLTKAANVNLFNNGVHNFNLGASQTRTSFPYGPSVNTKSGTLSWDHINGHGANLGLSRTSGIGDQFSLNSRANLFTSTDGRTRVDAYGGGSRWLNGPFANRNEFNFGLGGTHFFG